MGRIKSHRSSLKMGQVIRKKAKAKRERENKINKHKQMPKRSGKKIMVAPKSLPNRDEIIAEVHAGTEFINKNIRPLSSQVMPKTNQKAQMEMLTADINRQYRDRVIAAKESHAALQEAIANAPAFIEVLDARDPHACRYVEAEKKIKEAKKPLLIVLNKVDLIPREIAVSWIAELNAIAPTVAMSAIADEAASAVLSQAVAKVCPGVDAVAVFGVTGVGKSTICRVADVLQELPALMFVQSTEELVILNAAVWQEPMSTLAFNTLGRAKHSEEHPDIFSIFGISNELGSSEELLGAFSALWRLPQKKAAKKLITLFTSGEQLFYAVPAKMASIEETPEQTAALDLSVQSDLTTKQYVQFTSGKPIQVNDDILNETFEEEDAEEEEAEAAAEE